MYCHVLPEAEVNCQSPKLRPKIKEVQNYMATRRERAWFRKVSRQVKSHVSRRFNPKDPMVNDLAVVHAELPEFFSAMNLVPLRTTCRLYSKAKAKQVG